MKFRKKPVVIEAFQWDGTANWSERPSWILNHRMIVDDDCGLLIPTLEGTMKANIGDWIIKGVRDEIYPCKPDIFAATYEPAEEPPNGPR